jgi:MazG family protein
MKKNPPALAELLSVMARLRSPQGCPWDREQNHQSLRLHAVEEVYELIDAIDAGDDQERAEELGGLLLQVVFHCQLAGERGAFDFNDVARRIVEKLVRRHPHVFGGVKVKSVDEVWANWEKIKKAEKHGTKHARPSALDGIPKHLPALLKAEKLLKKARKASLAVDLTEPSRRSRKQIGRELFLLVQTAAQQGASAEDLLRQEISRQEKKWRRAEKQSKT